MDQSTRQVDRIRPAITMDGRDSVRTYDTAQGATRAAAWVIVTPTTGQESQQGGRDATMAQFQVIDQDSGPGWWLDTDLMEMDGIRYQVEGHVQDWPEPLPHTAFLVNRWEG
jgi:hypothetical protein